MIPYGSDIVHTLMAQWDEPSALRKLEKDLEETLPSEHPAAAAEKYRILRAIKVRFATPSVRQSERVAATLAAEARFDLQPGQVFPCTVTDISLTGALCELHNPQVGTLVRLNVALPDHEGPLSIDGYVARQIRDGFAIAFVDIPSEDREALVAYYKDMLAQKGPRAAGSVENRSS